MEYQQPGITKKQLQDSQIDLFYHEGLSDSTIAGKFNYFNNWSDLKTRLDSLKADNYTGVRVHVVGADSGTVNWGDGPSTDYTWPQGSEVYLEAGISQKTLEIVSTFFGITRIENKGLANWIIDYVGLQDFAIGFNTGVGEFHSIEVIGSINVTANVFGIADEDTGTLVFQDGPTLQTGSLFGVSATGNVYVRGRVTVQTNVADGSGSTGFTLTVLDRKAADGVNNTQNISLVRKYSPLVSSGPTASYDLGTSFTAMFQNPILGIDGTNSFEVNNVVGNRVSVFVGLFALSDTSDKTYPVQMTIGGVTRAIAEIPARVADGVNANAFYHIDMVVRSSDIVIYSCGRQEWGDVYFIQHDTIANPGGNSFDVLLEGHKRVAADTFQIDEYHINQGF